MLAIVLVTYNPDQGQLDSLLDRTIDAADIYVVVDNASRRQSEIPAVLSRRAVVTVLNSANVGLASALNLGIEKARQHGATEVLFLDQDSSITGSDIAKLRRTLTGLSKSNELIGSVGPAYIESNTGKSLLIPQAGKSAIDWQLPRVRKHSDAVFEQSIKGDFVITSGALVPVSTLERVGPMEDRLFIDLVDIEWGLRATSLGYSNFVACDVVVPHTIGNGCLTVFGKPLCIHDPIRNYFWARNAIALSRRSGIAMPWRIFFLKRYFIHTIIYSLFANRKLLRLKYFIVGGWHGMTGQWRTFTP